MSSEPTPPSAKAAERLAVIVDAAERAALKVIDDAEKEAKRYLEEAQGRADRIVAEHLREEADRLESNDGGGTESLLRPVAPEPVPAPPVEEKPAEDAQREPAEEEVPLPPPVKALPPEPPSKPSGGGSAAARLLATQMAVSGSSRTEIEMRLRNGFELEDTSEILDAILGPEE
jgi:hypothetical protein